MDMNTKARHDELDSWQRMSINQMLGASSPILPAGFAWRAIEWVLTMIGLWWLSVVALWIVAAFAGIYFEMAWSGWEFGRGALRWLWQMRG